MTHRDDRALAGALADARTTGRPCALATIVATRGSTPRKVGARMLVDPERGLTGTVGGGCGEAEVIEAAWRVIASGTPERVRVDLTDDLLSWSPAVCGGVMDVFVEAVAPPPAVDEALTPPGERVAIHYRRIPDREDVFDQQVVEVTADGTVVTLAEAARITHAVRAEGEVILEPGAPVVWFTFPGFWHDIGRFHLADGTFTGCYANVLTPPEMTRGRWDTTDLFLDVWLPASGGEVVLLDEDEFEAARTAGQLDAWTADRARTEAERLLEQARAGAWPPPVVGEWTLEAALARLAER